MTANFQNTIKNQLILLFTIFGGIAALICIFGGFVKSWTNLIYPSLFAIGMTVFGLLTLIGIELLKQFREKRFFQKTPYNQIEKRTLKKIQVIRSKYDFPKTQRIIELDGNEYAVEYYDDIFKMPIPGVLLIYNQTELDLEPILINYKEKKYNETELLSKIRNG
ncbi:hypothetical protein BWZ20_00580 [Winogradskyella sp. J14-2]|uniref:hypothetical protein n=1 Tax=Winogradskyella sp. J14-2 TaxID=1936080 RepID=UPI000972D99C|nr:hypothetical protein [Winogradskyella sp. J14-2]APY06882.1 hypothetical protein BWZ20_00580 [Winogradskyella sp. J14-2]